MGKTKKTKEPDLGNVHPENRLLAMKLEREVLEAALEKVRYYRNGGVYGALARTLKDYPEMLPFGWLFKRNPPTNGSKVV